MSGPYLEKSFNVFTRWRPLIEAETKVTEIEHSKTLEKNKLYSTSIDLPPHSWQSKGAFTEVYEPEDDNAKIAAAIVAQAIPHVLEGASCNVFAYGHTGSGKTHTVVGYNYEQDSRLGLCPAAGRRLFEQLQAVEETRHLGIGLNIVELRKNVAIDLLNDRTECHIRQGPDGKTHMRGETEMFADGKVRVKPVTKQPCWGYHALCETLRQGLQDRSVGSSTVHDQSSRTHAIIELEIVSTALIDARNALYDRQSELVPKEDCTWVLNPDAPVNQAVIDAAEAQKVEYEARVSAAEQEIDTILQANPTLGGKFVFVDLAGSEYYTAQSQNQGTRMTQTPQEKQEGRQINTDLLALKEVMRAVASKQKRIPFRSSPLTMVLREHFLGSRGAASNMIVTVSPAEEQYAATVNSLKYGSLVGTACA